MEDLKKLTNTELIFKYGVVIKEFMQRYSRKQELENYIKDYDGLITPDEILLQLINALNDYEEAYNNKKEYEKEIKERYNNRMQKAFSNGSNEEVLKDIEREKNEELLEAEELPF